MNPMLFRSKNAFTLIELLVVIGIIAVLAAILLPVANKTILKSYESKTVANLKNLSVAFNLHVTDNDGYLPAAARYYGMPDAENEKAETWWLYSLKPYFSIKDDGVLGKNIHDPYFYKIANEPIIWWRPGWAMNGRMGLSVGDNAGVYSRNVSSYYICYKMNRYPGDAILLGPSFSQVYQPDNAGNVADDRFSQLKNYNVPHNKRIGADSKGQGGKSAYYLLLSGAAKNLTPLEAAPLLKLRTP